MPSKNMKAATPHRVEVPVNVPARLPKPTYVSDVIAKLLRQMEFEHAFLLPGASYRGLHDSMVNYLGNRDPEMVMGVHEQTVVSMAHGYAKATGEPALCILHDLVGLMNGTMGIYNAWADHAPMVILGGSGPLDPSKRRPIEWLHSARSQSDMVKGYVKWTAEPSTPQAIMDTILEAKRIAATPPYGPTYVSIDCALQESDDLSGFVIPDLSADRYAPPPPIAADPESLSMAAAKILAAKSPLIVGGRIGIDAATTKPLVELVEQTGAAYQDDWRSVSFPTAHPQNLTGDGATLDAADVVVTFDCLDVSDVVGISRMMAAKGSAAVHAHKWPTIIDFSANILARSTWSDFGDNPNWIDHTFVCDPKLGLRQLLAEVKKQRRNNAALSTRVTRRRAALSKRHDQIMKTRVRERSAGKKDMPIREHRLIGTLADALVGKDWRLVALNRHARFEGLLPFDGAGQFMGESGGGGVGYGPGAAVGAALAMRGSGSLPVGIVGDGDYVLSPGAVWTAAHYRIPLLLVINDNSSWGNDEHHQMRVARARKRPVENAWIGQRMADPSIEFATVARGFGAWAEGPVIDPADLPDVFARAIGVVEGGGVAVVEVRTAL